MRYARHLVATVCRSQHPDLQDTFDRMSEVRSSAARLSKHDLDPIVSMIIRQPQQRVRVLLLLGSNVGVIDLDLGLPSAVPVAERLQLGGPFAAADLPVHQPSSKRSLGQLYRLYCKKKAKLMLGTAHPTGRGKASPP